MVVFYDNSLDDKSKSFGESSLTIKNQDERDSKAFNLETISSDSESLYEYGFVSKTVKKQASIRKKNSITKNRKLKQQVDLSTE
jgi:hypothetical protein